MYINLQVPQFAFDSAEGFRLSLGLAVGESSRLFQFSLKSVAPWSPGTGSFHHPLFSHEFMQKEAAVRKEAVEKEVERLLGRMQQGNVVETGEKLQKLGALAIEPLIRFLERIVPDLSRPRGQDLRKSKFYTAVEALGHLGGERAARALPALLDRVRGDDELGEVIIALGQTKHPIAFEPILRFLEDERPVIREAAAIALGELGDKRAVEPLISKLYDDHESVRSEAAVALIDLKDRRAVEPLVAILTEERPAFSGKLLREMIEGLGDFGDVRVLASLMGGDYKWSSQYRPVVVDAMKKLIDLPGVSDLSFDLGKLMTCASSTDPSLSAIAHRILESLDLDTLMSQADPHVRYAAAAVLEERGRPVSQDLLMEAVLNHPEERIRFRAARRLDPIKDPLKAEAVGRILFKDGGKAAKEALRLIEDAPGDAVTDVLFTNIRALRAGMVAAVLLRRGADRDPKIFEAIVGIMVDHVASGIQEAVFKHPEAGRVLRECLEENPSFLEKGEIRAYLKTIPEPEIQELVGKHEQEAEALRREEEIRKQGEKILRREETRLREQEEIRRQEERLREEEREALLEKTETIVEDIREKISDRLKLGMSHRGSASNGNTESYASVSSGSSVGLKLELGLRQELTTLLEDHIEIEMGETLEDLRERFRTLNFLVHHEVAHVIQDKLGIERPRIDFGSLNHLDPQAAEHHANEIVIDKLGFDAARKIYVSGDGDLMFDEDMRESVAVHSYAALMGIVLRNLKSGAHAMKGEALARFIAVTREMAGSEAIAPKVKAHLEALADELSNDVTADIRSLIDLYRTIFRETGLTDL